MSLNAQINLVQKIIILPKLIKISAEARRVQFFKKEKFAEVIMICAVHFVIGKYWEYSLIQEAVF